MTLPLVLLTRALPDAWIDRLAGQCRLEVGPAEEPGWHPRVAARLPEAEGILCLLTERIDADVLRRAPRVRVVSNMAVGVDNIDVAACTARGIPVGHTPDVLTAATADLTMALLLAAARRLPQAAATIPAGQWTTWSPTGHLGADLEGARLGIVGLGKIGRAVAQRARAFGMEVVAAASARPETSDPQVARVPLATLWASSDFVSLHCPLTADNRGLVSAQVLASFKPGAILINTARGPLVDTEALVAALHRGHLRAAALDVTDPEPLPADHPLLSAPNAFVVPHIGSATDRTRRRMAEMACDNLLAGLRGEPLPHCINARELGR